MRLSKNWTIVALLAAVIVCAFLVIPFPNKHDRAGKVGDLSELPPEQQHFFHEDLDLFEVKRPAGGSDWLAHHHEEGQTFGQYLRFGANQPDQDQSVLYVLPLGEFTPEAPSLSSLGEFMSIYYAPLEVRFLDAVPESEVKAKQRLNNGSKQWKSTDILKWMKPRLPQDAYAMIGVTMTDLYPDEKWNFVFGQASLKERVGVFSLARYGSEDKALSLLRAGKVLTHEMGHMFGIQHCIYYQCNMNGANNLEEADASPPHLCPVCLRKFHHAVGFDPAQRYQKLEHFYRTHGMEEAADWVSRRLEP